MKSFSDFNLNEKSLSELKGLTNDDASVSDILRCSDLQAFSTYQILYGLIEQMYDSHGFEHVETELKRSLSFIKKAPLR